MITFQEYSPVLLVFSWYVGAAARLLLCLHLAISDNLADPYFDCVFLTSTSSQDLPILILIGVFLTSPSLQDSWLLCKTTFVHWSLIRQQIGIKFGSLIPACTQLRRSLQKVLGGLCTLQASRTRCPSFRSIFVCSWAWGKRSTLNLAPLFQSVHSSGKPGLNFLAACAHCRPVIHDACLSDLFLSTAGHEVKDRH